jgi:transcriptional regulator with XRE-family HTH domain
VVKRNGATLGCESPGYKVTDRRMVPIHGRELGRRLRAVQREAGLDGIQLSRMLNVSESRVSRLTNGLIFPSVADVAELLAVCGVFGEGRDQILDLVHPRHDGDVVRISDGTQWEAFLYHASSAAEWVEYQPLMIPWLVQTEDYVHAYWTSSQLDDQSGLSKSKLDHGPAVALRSGLGKIELLVHEWALRAPVASRAARSVQMHGLLSLSTSRKMSLRVIPATRTIPAIAQSGFTVLKYADRPTVLYREEPTSGVFFDDPDQVAAHLQVVWELRRAALPKAQSFALLEQIRDEPDPEVASSEQG